MIAVSDYENKCVSLFDADGQYQARLGAGKLLGPKGVTVTREGDTIVVDNKVLTYVSNDHSGRSV